MEPFDIFGGLNSTRAITQNMRHLIIPLFSEISKIPANFLDWDQKIGINSKICIFWEYSPKNTPSTFFISVQGRQRQSRSSMPGKLACVHKNSISRKIS